MITAAHTVSSVDVDWWFVFATGFTAGVVTAAAVAVACRHQLPDLLDRAAVWARKVVEGEPLPATHPGPLPAPLAPPGSHLRLIHSATPPVLFDQDAVDG